MGLLGTVSLWLVCLNTVLSVQEHVRALLGMLGSVLGQGTLLSQSFSPPRRIKLRIKWVTIEQLGETFEGGAVPL